MDRLLFSQPLEFSWIISPAETPSLNRTLAVAAVLLYVGFLAAVGARPVLAELLPGSGRSLTAREPDVGITSPKPTAGEPEA